MRQAVHVSYLPHRVGLHAPIDDAAGLEQQQPCLTQQQPKTLERQEVASGDPARCLLVSPFLETCSRSQQQQQHQQQWHMHVPDAHLSNLAHLVLQVR